MRHPPVDRLGRCVGQSRLETTVSTAEAVRVVVEGAPFVPVRLYSSDLPRCAILAEGLATAWRIPLELNAGLREMSFGEWEGRSYDEIDAEDGVRWRTWCADWRNQTPPGGESVDAFTQRVEAWLSAATLCSQTAVVTHAGVIRVLQVLNGTAWDDAMATDHPFLGWMRHPFPPALQRRGIRS